MCSKSETVHVYHVLQVRDHTRLPCAPSPRPHISTRLYVLQVRYHTYLCHPIPRTRLTCAPNPRPKRLPMGSESETVLNVLKVRDHTHLPCAPIAKPRGCDVLPNDCTTRFVVGAKIPTSKAGWFLPSPWTELCIHSAKRHTRVSLLLSHTLFVKILAFFRNVTVSDRRKWSLGTTALVQLNLSLWWRHNVYLWRHNGARRHARGKHYGYCMPENCVQTTCVH